MIFIPRVNSQRLRLLTQRLPLRISFVPSRFRSDIQRQRFMDVRQLIPSRSGSHFNTRQLKRSLVMNITLELWHVSLLVSGSVVYLLLRLTSCGMYIHTFISNSHQTRLQQSSATKFIYF